jgi:photosystem II stability/assembly factor-like uncharacterized protein
VVEIMSTTGNLSEPENLVRVFVSYAREDRRWLDPDYRYSLIPFLVDSLRRHNVAFWFDKELKPGDEFRRYIESEIDQSQIALLIVSQSFLNSEFIENREMPRIAERARLRKMLVVPVLVEPCDWSEYPFLADRQMVPSSPLIEYTESEPQWVKVRFQILDGLKAQLKRIREAPQSRVEKAQASAPEEIPSASAPSAVAHDPEMYTATLKTANAPEDVADPLKQQARTFYPVLPPSTSAGAVLENPTMISTAGREKARNPIKWVIAIAAGAILVIALVLLIIFTGREKPWTARSSGTSSYLESIFASSDGQHLWAVGVNGTILESDDGGATWVARYSGTTENLNSLFGSSDGQHLWAVGGKGTILESGDGGATWAARNSGTTQILCSIFGTSDGGRLWAVGSSDYPIDNTPSPILESDDGGASWIARKSGTPLYLNSIFGTSDGQRLWAVGIYGMILESDDRGANWAVRKSGASGELKSIFGTSDGSRLWVVGNDGTILESVDGGATWTAQNSGTENHLYSVFGSSDGQDLWAVGDKGTIVESVDEGASWKSRNSGTKMILSSISETSNGQHRWAVGEIGTILESNRR